MVFVLSSHGRGGAVLPCLREDVPARLPVSSLQHQRAAVVLQLSRGRCLCDRLRSSASLSPFPGSHHTAGPHTGEPENKLVIDYLGFAPICPCSLKFSLGNLKNVYILIFIDLVSPC